MVLCPISVFCLRWNCPLIRCLIGSVCNSMPTFTCLRFCVSLYMLVCLRVPTNVSMNAFLCVCSTEKQNTGGRKALLWRPMPRNVCSYFTFHFPSMWEEPCIVFGFMKCWHSGEERMCLFFRVKRKQLRKMHSVPLGLASPLPAGWTFYLPWSTIPVAPEQHSSVPSLQKWEGEWHCDTWPYKGGERPSYDSVLPSCQLYIHWRPFKETWCVQGNHPQAVHPFSMLLQNWCLQALRDSEV